MGMMTEAEATILAFGGLSKLAKALGHRNVTTVQGWKGRGSIPSWRRREVMDAATAHGVQLPADFFPPIPTPPERTAQ